LTPRGAHARSADGRAQRALGARRAVQDHYRA